MIDASPHQNQKLNKEINTVTHLYGHNTHNPKLNISKIPKVCDSNRFQIHARIVIEKNIGIN